MLVEDLELPAFDPFDPDLRGERFHAAMAELRGRGWLAKAPIGWVVTEREAASFFLRTRSATFPGQRIAELFGIESGPLREEIDRNILHIDGDDHRRLRNLVNPAFTPRAVDRYRPAMRRFLGELLDAVPTDGRCELVADVAKPYPSLVIAELMGVPPADAPRLHHWSNWIQRQFDGPSLLAERPAIERAVEEFYAYAGELLERRRATPGDDLVSSLLAAEAEGDRLTDTECVNLVLNVLVGGIDTTQSQLAHTVRLLAQHPGQWAELRADPDGLAGPAVEEALRHEPVTPFTARIVREDISYRDVTFPKDTVVMVCAFTANRDVPGPDAFDITADRGGARPLTFGAGVHYCLGANLARAELGEALALLARRYERIELDGEPQLGTIAGIYGVDRLPVRLVPARDADRCGPS